MTEREERRCGNCRFEAGWNEKAESFICRNYSLPDLRRLINARAHGENCGGYQPKEEPR